MSCRLYPTNVSAQGRAHGRQVRRVLHFCVCDALWSPASSRADRVWCKRKASGRGGVGQHRGFSNLPPAIATRSAKSETLSARRQLQSDAMRQLSTACTDPNSEERKTQESSLETFILCPAVGAKSPDHKYGSSKTYRQIWFPLLYIFKRNARLILVCPTTHK